MAVKAYEEARKICEEIAGEWCRTFIINYGKFCEGMGARFSIKLEMTERNAGMDRWGI